MSIPEALTCEKSIFPCHSLISIPAYISLEEAGKARTFSKEETSIQAKNRKTIKIIFLFIKNSIPFSLRSEGTHRDESLEIEAFSLYNIP